MKNKQSRKKEFINNPKRALWKLSIPMMLGMSVQSLYMLIDTLLISRIVGETSMAALGFAFPFLLNHYLIFLSNALFLIYISGLF